VGYATRGVPSRSGRIITDFPDVSLDLANQIVQVTMPYGVAPDWAPWQPDSAVTRCPGCGREFGVFLRKHHCRQCGKVYRDDCSKGKAQVRRPAAPDGARKESNGMVRICKFCAVSPRLGRRGRRPQRHILHGGRQVLDRAVLVAEGDNRLRPPWSSGSSRAATSMRSQGR
jgi:hypothetical protein